MEKIAIPQYPDILKAHERIKPYVHRTPVLTSRGLDGIFKAQVFFKCENFQKVGAFKYRGATNAVLTLSDEDAKKGVVTHSSGNHAAALSLAAQIRNIKAEIVMPENAPKIKKQAVESYQGTITFCEPTLAAREQTMGQIVEKTGATVVHPYNNFMVISGQGTAAKEFLEDCPELDIIMTPVGGGGLLSGTAIAAKYLSPGIRVIAAEPEGAKDAYLSFQKGEIVPSQNPKTIADGLLTSLGTLTFSIIQKNTDEIVTVSEAMIVQGMRLIWERMKIIVEPSSAVPVGALLQYPEKFYGLKIGIILSGGNVDLERLPFIS